MTEKITEKPKYLDLFASCEGVEAFFTTRHGATEISPFNNKEILGENRFAGKTVVWPRQTHSSNIAVIKDAAPVADSEGLWDNEGDKIIIPDTDGVITNRNDVLLTTVHADCLAVYLYDPIAKAIGLVHAGWRGTVASIAAKAMEMMKSEYDSSPENVLIEISPGISRCCFETGPEVYDEFCEAFDFMDGCADYVPETGKYFIDLKEVNRRQLMAIGIHEDNINISKHCTCCEPDMFVSYRREGGTKARLGAGLAIK